MSLDTLDAPACAPSLDASAMEVAGRRQGRWTTAPFALLRYATLPCSALQALRPARCHAALDRAEAALEAMATLAPALTDDLFALVSRIAKDARQYRRDVLQLKREIHNRTPTRLDDAVLDRVQADLAEPGARRLGQWRRAQSDAAREHADAERLFDAELSATLRPGLRGLLAEDAFRRGLALAAPGVLAHAARERRLPDKPAADNFERSLLGYAIRASAKTSPFSSFMATTVVDVSAGVPATLDVGPGLQLHCRPRLNRGLLARLHAAAAATGGLPGPLRANPTLTRIGHRRFRAMCDRLVVVLGRPWRQQMLTNFQLHDTLSGALLGSAGAATADAWIERFVAAGIDPARAEALVPQLLARGILTCPAPIDAFDAEPWVALRAAFAGCGSAPLQGAAGALDRMADCCARAGVPDDHGEHAARIRALEADTLARLGAPGPEPLQNVVLEDCWATGVDGAVAAGPCDDAIQDLAGFLSTQIGESVHYRRLRARFLARYGAGGQCTDALGFLCEAGAQLLEPLEFGSNPADEDMPPAAAGAALPVTVQAQVVADADPGSPRLVVNKVFEHMGWLAARFAVGDTREHARLREGLRRWIAQVAGDREPVDLPVGGDCNDLQAHPRLTARVLRLPGEPCMGGGVIECDQLRIRHDPASGLLIPSDRDGRELHVCYLGGTLPSPTWGVPYALVVLGQPYQLMRPAYQPPALGHRAEVEFVPRMRAGRVVVRRAMWWMRTDYLRRAWFASRGAMRLAAVRGERRVFGLPEVGFVRRPLQDAGPVASHAALDARRKPLWVDTGNPFCLDLLERLCDGVEWISFAEALPDPGQQWLRLQGRPHVSELQFELLLRRPE
jgi:hypothetical protein